MSKSYYLKPSDFPKELVVGQIEHLQQKIKKEYDNFGRCPLRLRNSLKTWEEELERIIYFEERDKT